MGHLNILCINYSICIMLLQLLFALLSWSFDKDIILIKQL